MRSRGNRFRWIIVLVAVAIAAIVMNGTAASAVTRVTRATASIVAGKHTTTKASTAGATATTTSQATAATPTAKAATKTATSQTTASSDPLTVVVFGDSVPSGSACDCTAFGTLVANQLGATQGRTVSVINYAVGGSTSADVLQQLQSTSIRNAVAKADLVIVETGANDFSESDASASECTTISACYGEQLATTTANIRQMANTIEQLEKSNAQTSLIGYWNVFQDGAVGDSEGANYVATSDALTKALNSSIAAIASQTEATSPDVYQAFKGVNGTTDPTKLLAADGDHPNATGHEVIAASVYAALGTSVSTL